MEQPKRKVLEIKRGVESLPVGQIDNLLISKNGVIRLVESQSRGQKRKR